MRAEHNDRLQISGGRAFVDGRGRDLGLQVSDGYRVIGRGDIVAKPDTMHILDVSTTTRHANLWA